MKVDRIKCGRKYEIKRAKSEKFNAWIIFENKTIWVNTSLRAKAFREAVFHELAHVLIQEKKFTLGRMAIAERCCDLAAELVERVLRDNPGLQNKWYGKEK